MWLLEFSDITYELLDVYNTVVFTKLLAETEPTFSRVAKTASPATFNVPRDVIELLALIVQTFAVFA